MTPIINKLQSTERSLWPYFHVFRLKKKEVDKMRKLSSSNDPILVRCATK